MTKTSLWPSIAMPSDSSCATTAEVDTTFEKVRAFGAEVLQEPMDKFYGVRDCAFRDSSGKTVRISRTAS